MSAKPNTLVINVRKVIGCKDCRCRASCTRTVDKRVRQTFGNEFYMQVGMPFGDGCRRIRYGEFAETKLPVMVGLFIYGVSVDTTL